MKMLFYFYLIFFFIVMYLYTYSISVSDISDINSVNLKEDFGIKINAKKSSRKTITLAESLLKKS